MTPDAPRHDLTTADVARIFDVPEHVVGPSPMVGPRDVVGPAVAAGMGGPDEFCRAVSALARDYACATHADLGLLARAVADLAHAFWADTRQRLAPGGRPLWDDSTGDDGPADGS